MSFRTIRKPVTVCALTILGGYALTGCAATPPPPELLDARAAYIRASSGPAAQVKPDSLHVAKVALDKAETAFSDDPGSQETKDIAYLALRQSELAEAEGRNVLAANEKARAERELANLTQNQLSRTREQLASAAERLSASEQQIANERAARDAAEKRAQEAMEKIGGKQESRGTVITVPGNVLFATGKSTLLPGALARLESVAAALKDVDREIVVEGHTDSQGSEGMNLNLSLARAQRVRDYLAGQGVPANRIRATGVGEERPIADNGTVEGRALNRRVEIIVAPASASPSTTGRGSTTNEIPPSTERKPTPGTTAPPEK
jgi:outer membrane protein OmpA-like peptidoglycan-associated protein